MTEVPEFSDDSDHTRLDADDPLSNTSVKGAIKWNRRDKEYVFVWWQNVFWVATENGGYSMTKSLLDSLPDHIEQIWVVDDNTNSFKRFDRSQYEGAEVIDGDDDRFENVSPEAQIAVDRKQAKETYDLSEVDV